MDDKDPEDLPRKEAEAQQETLRRARESAPSIAEIIRQARLAGLMSQREIQLSGSLLGARIDAGLAELAQRVIEMAEQQVRSRAAEPVTRSADEHLTAAVELTAPTLMFGAQPITPMVMSDQPTVPERTSYLTTRRMLYILIGLIALCLYLGYTDLSPQDQQNLVAAISIGSLALGAAVLVPPDNKG
jgi:hypothetical protein